MTDAERETWAGMVARITSALPPGFIALLFVNLIFIALTYWFLDRQVEARAAMISKIIDVCTDRIK